MKKLLLFLTFIFACISVVNAENQRYVVSNKAGKARFTQVEETDGKWQYVKYAQDIYLENGFEFEGFEVTNHNFMSKRDPGLLFQYDGKYYKVINPEKDIKPVDENGETTSGLGIRNYLSNTALGDFYRTKTPGLVALLCIFLSAIFLISSFSKENVSMFIRWGYALPVCVISILEIGAAFSLGTDAAWWVNPDDVGYWIATPLLIPYAIVAAYMIFSYKLYGFVGEVNGLSNIVISVLLVIGIILTVISAIFVVINFLFAAFVLIFAGWMFKGIDVKDNDGGTTNIGPLGTYKTDRYGNTTHK
ncbi:MAG: hypothetical protein K2H98_02200 [Duncaniella sp.]|nr:hypothetical protein [Duncaniella sp.]